jgi:hypothetical protein
VKRIRPSARHSGITILDAINDPQLFAPWFKNAATWQAWLSFLCALFALPMTREQRRIYRECTGRQHVPSDPAEEGWLCIGRRGGKSFIMALVAVFLACFRDYRPFLAPGERATVMVIAADRKQARIVLRFVRALLTRVAMLAQMVQREWNEGFDLSNGTTIEVHSASFRSTRGYSLAAVIADEVAYWRTDDSAEPDYEIINALRPGMATIPGALLLCASSPYARRGELWRAHRSHYGKEGDPILVWQADTQTMNPSVPKRIIEAAYERDPASAAAEYGAQFRSDIEAFIAREVVEACIDTSVRERPPLSSTAHVAFVDPSGGSSDSMTMAVGHREDKAVILDCLRERRPPFSPDAVVEEFAATLKSYGITKVTGDRYGGEWPRERFKVYGITYECAEKPKSVLYQTMLPCLNARTIALLDNDRLVSQLCSLERRTARGGKDSIDHAPGGHDDLANVTAGVCTLLAKGRYDSSYSWVFNEGSDLETMGARLLKQYAFGRFM